MEPLSSSESLSGTPTAQKDDGTLLTSPALLYTTMDGFEKGIPSMFLNAGAVLIFGTTTAFAVYNMIKFYKHRSYALGIFYIFTVLNLISRCAFFSTIFFTETSYLTVVLMCSPANFSCAIGLCQIMNYVVLYIRLDSYESHRKMKRGDSISDEELNKTTVREKIALTALTLGIVAYPIIIGILLAIHAPDYNGNVINAWQKYEVFYMFNFIAIAILLTISTCSSLSHMRRVFGAQSMKEERSIKVMLLLFMGTYLVRVIFAVAFHIYQNWVEKIFSNSNTYFDLLVLLLWICWDVVPICCILYIHYNNFSSFADEEILYTEYSVDDQRDSITQRFSFQDSSEDLMDYNNLETSGVINLEGPDSSEDSESNASQSPSLNRQQNPYSIINKKREPALVSKSLRLDKTRSGSIKMQVSGMSIPEPVSQSHEQMKFLRSAKKSRGSGATSRTVSAKMLRWSLARSIQLGIFSRRVFTKEMIKASSRKSTIDIKSRLLINPDDDEEYRDLVRLSSKRSRSHADLNESDSGSDEQD